MIVESVISSSSREAGKSGDLCQAASVHLSILAGSTGIVEMSP
jgi:hypothetical protein